MDSETLEFTQEELRVLAVILSQVSMKITDAIIVVPIFEKIRSKVKEEPQPEVPLEPQEGVKI